MTTLDPQVLVDELLTRRTWSIEHLRAYQQERLTALLRHAAENSPYYARTLGERDPESIRLTDMPTLTKTQLRANFDDIVTGSELDLASIERHLDGEDASTSLHGYRVFATSGTTGPRVPIAFAEEEFALNVAAFVRATSGFNERGRGSRVIGIGAPCPQHISQQIYGALMRDGLEPPAPALSVNSPMTEIVEALNEFQPEVLATYASLAAMLAEEQLAGRLHIAPATIGTAGEVLTSEMRARIGAAFGVRPHQTYACTEVPVFASSGADHDGLRLWEDLAVIEVVDENDRPVAPGQPGHKVLVTSLVNHTVPLIRYEISDSVTLLEERAGAYRQIVVDGRNEDIVRLPSVDGGTVEVYPHHLHAPFGQLPGVLQYQYTADGDALSLAVVPRIRAEGPALAQRVGEVITDHLTELGAKEPTVSVVAVDRLDRDVSHAGKFRMIRRDVRADA